MNTTSQSTTPRADADTGTTGAARATGEPEAVAAASSADTARPWPTPWTKPEDREGWELVARGQGRRDLPPVRTSIIISVVPEQADWIKDAAAAAGLSPEAFVLRLIDEARRRP